MELNDHNDEKTLRFCPNCHNMIAVTLDEDPLDHPDRSFKTNCEICTENDQSPFAFCWACARPWKSTEETNCGNLRCNEEVRRERMEAISNCPLIAIQSQEIDCPSQRLCPHCLALVVHQGGCKYVTCPECRNHYCFSCLDVKIDGEYSNCTEFCMPAPRQNGCDYDSIRHWMKMMMKSKIGL
mmetsp:Transcript_32732/g.37115  ORF Transcript_32732/g.37115 Transcript_32732/m.37115 type:complete len:183 (+) Transcript_32732:41-589(+)